MTAEIALQDQGSVLECYGCGSQNEQGYQFKSFLRGDQAFLDFIPKQHHCGGGLGYVYGGLLASIIDCHSCNLAIGLAYRSENRNVGSEPRIKVVTAQLNVTFKKPTMIDQPIAAVARVIKAEGRKTWVKTEITSQGEITAWGEVLCVRRSGTRL